MPIVSSVIVINHAEESELNRRIREIHTDHLGGETVFNYIVLLNVSGNVVDSEGTILFNTLADKTAANAVIALERLAAQEIHRWISEMESGGDPWHTIPYVNVVPEFNTWETAASMSLKHWLLFDYKQELLNCDLSANSTSNGDLDDLLILASSTFTNTDLRSEIQNAINTQVDLDAYTSSVVE